MCLGPFIVDIGEIKYRPAATRHYLAPQLFLALGVLSDNGGRDFAELANCLSKMYLKCISSVSK